MIRKVFQKLWLVSVRIYGVVVPERLADFFPKRHD